MRSLGGSNMPFALDTENVLDTTVGEWIKLDGDQRPLQGFVQHGILKSGSEIWVEPFDHNPQSVQPDTSSNSTLHRTRHSETMKSKSCMHLYLYHASRLSESLRALL